jgi:hypothetical protein
VPTVVPTVRPVIPSFLSWPGANACDDMPAVVCVLAPTTLCVFR